MKAFHDGVNYFLTKHSYCLANFLIFLLISHQTRPCKFNINLVVICQKMQFVNPYRLRKASILFNSISCLFLFLKANFNLVPSYKTTIGLSIVSHETLVHDSKKSSRKYSNPFQAQKNWKRNDHLNFAIIFFRPAELFNQIKL